MGISTCLQMLTRVTSDAPKVLRSYAPRYSVPVTPLTPGAPCGGHAWSRDGYHFTDLVIGAFGPIITFANGTQWRNAYVERPLVPPSNPFFLVLQPLYLVYSNPSPWYSNPSSWYLPLLPGTPTPLPVLQPWSLASAPFTPGNHSTLHPR